MRIGWSLGIDYSFQSYRFFPASEPGESDRLRPARWTEKSHAIP